VPQHEPRERRPLVVIAEPVSPATVPALGEGVEVRHVDGTDRPSLLAAVADASALVVRSATRVDADLLAAAPRLRVVARAGTGLSNVDVRAATVAGVMVVTAPQANPVSAAELTVGLMIAAARHVVPAHRSLQEGSWERSAFTGTELHGKTLGVLGLGRVGQLVADRMRAFGMQVLAHDPYVQPGRAAQRGVRLVDLDTLLTESDVLTVHLPRTPQTRGLVDHCALTRVKPSLVLVNAARGGIVDEQALADALREGRVAAAAVDVFDHEPATGSPLLGLDRVVATPHLGASTAEAQEKAGVAVARSVVAALAGEVVPDAVNVQGGSMPEAVRPAVPLVERLGRLFSHVAGELAAALDVEVRGELADLDVRILELAALKGAFGDVVDEAVTYVNVPALAAERGTACRLVTDRECPDHRNLITLRGTLADGCEISVGASLSERGRSRLVEVMGYAVDLALGEHLVLLVHTDKPGAVGVVGGLLGDAGVNIAGMQVSRHDVGGDVLVALDLDGPLPPGTLDLVVEAVGASWARSVTLP